MANNLKAMIELAYGRKPILIPEPENLVQVLKNNVVPPVDDLKSAVREAINSPIGSPPLKDLARNPKKIAIVVSDFTRNVPRSEVLEVLLKDVINSKEVELSLIIANGNHPANPISSLELRGEILERFSEILNHRSLDSTFLEKVGTTSGGTDVELNRLVVKADLRILIGQIKPHYFMGYSGGAKSIVPGVAGLNTIETNHMKKTMSRSRLGMVKNNPARGDAEEAALFLGPTFIINTILNGAGKVARVVAGDVVKAQREGCLTAQKVSIVRAKKTDIVIISETFPMALNVYQTTKLVPPAARILAPGGVIIVVSCCEDGVGPLNLINQAIYEIGLKNFLPEDHTIYLKSELPDHLVNETFFRPIRDVEEVLEMAQGSLGKGATVTVIPRGGHIITVRPGEDTSAWL